VPNDQLLSYSRATDDLANIVLVVVNLDPRFRQAGSVELSLEAFGLDSSQRYVVHDLLSNSRYTWQGPRNYVELDPGAVPAHIFKLR